MLMDVIQIYGGSLGFKKTITGQDKLPFVPLKILSLASNTVILFSLFLPLSAAVLEVSFGEYLYD